MDYLIVGIAALLGAGLTLITGFGLGTLLLAVFVLFFPPGVAVAATAIVHFLNNIFKLGLLGRHADRSVVIRFGLPAVIGAWLGAQALGTLAGLPSLWSYVLGGTEHSIMPVKLAIGLLLLSFAWLELLSRARVASMPPSYLPIGGLLSGFFGGLSGHQGALRSMFLLKTGLSRDAFIATGIVIALLIDMTRLSTYFAWLKSFDWGGNAWLMACATFSAFIGSVIGRKLLPSFTLGSVERLVSIALVIIALGLISGLL